MSETTKPEVELLYSGVVETHAVQDPGWGPNDDFVRVTVWRRRDEEFMFIETAPEPVRIMLRLDKRQADCLYRCMRNAMARWDGREP
jgi:hypothetical protein